MQSQREEVCGTVVKILELGVRRGTVKGREWGAGGRSGSP